MSLSNVTSSSCARWRAALARQAGGGAPATILCAGDSNTQDDTGLFMWHEVLRANLQAAQPDTWDEGFAYFVAPTGLDPERRTFGTNWVITATGQSGPALNGILVATASGGTPFEYGPVNCDTFRLFYRHYGAGTFKWSVDDGALSSAVSVAGGTGDVGYVDIPAGAAGSHTLKLHAIATSIQPVFIGVAWTTSAAVKRRVAATGRFGAGTDDWTSGVSLPNVYEGLAPDLTIAVIGSNDYGFHELSTSATIANLTEWIATAAAAGSDFLLLVPAPSNYSAGAIVEPPADLVTALHALSISEDVPLLDMKARWVDFNTAKFTNGYISDHVHFTTAGHADGGAATFEAVRAISGEGQWHDVTAERWNGSAWEDVIAEQSDGTAWEDVPIEQAT